MKRTEELRVLRSTPPASIVRAGGDVEHSSRTARHPAVETYNGTPCPKGHTLRYKSNYRCVECRSEKFKEWRSRRTPEQIEAKRSRDREYGLRTWRARYEKNREAAYEWARVWRKQNPEKARAMKRLQKLHREERLRGRGRLSADIAENLLHRQRGLCVLCAKELDVFHLDHIVAIARGGPNTDDNVQLLCPPCNLRKGAK